MTTSEAIKKMVYNTNRCHKCIYNVHFSSDMKKLFCDKIDDVDIFEICKHYKGK